MADYMGKRVNAFLLIMIILVLLGMGGLSIYYQRTFKDVNSQYDTLTGQFQSCQENLTLTASTLQNTLSNLNSTETDIKKYDTLYSQKASELDDTKKTLTNTQAALQKETLFKQQFQKQSEDYWRQILGLNVTVGRLNNQVLDLQDTISELEDEVSCLQAKSDSSEYLC